MFVVYAKYDRLSLPRGFLADEEVGIVYTQANLITLLPDKSVSEGLESGQEEGARGGKMRNCEADVRDRHCSTKERETKIMKKTKEGD